MSQSPSASQAAGGRAWLVKAGRGRYLQLDQLRRIRPQRKRFELEFLNGETTWISWGARHALSEALGLVDLYQLPFPDHHRPLYEEGLRDWPEELMRSKRLKDWFGNDERRLILNLAWQAFRWRDRQLGYGHDHRGFWYRPVAPALRRAGFLSTGVRFESLSWTTLTDIGLALKILGKDRHYALYELLLAALVGDYKLCVYEDLGFTEPRPDRRAWGERADWVVMAEKGSLEEVVLHLHRRFQTSYIIFGGIPSLVATEFFAKGLAARTNNPVRLAALVDFDPSGWIAGHAFGDQLRRYGLQVDEPVFLNRPERFTPEELELFAYPIKASTPQRQGKVQAWLRQSGGINGQPLGIHADHLRPFARVEQALRDSFT